MTPMECHTLYASYAPCVILLMTRSHPTIFKNIIIVHINCPKKFQSVKLTCVFILSNIASRICFLETQTDSHRDRSMIDVRISCTKNGGIVVRNKRKTIKFKNF